MIRGSHQAITARGVGQGAMEHRTANVVANLLGRRAGFSIFFCHRRIFRLRCFCINSVPLCHKLKDSVSHGRFPTAKNGVAYKGRSAQIVALRQRWV